MPTNDERLAALRQIPLFEGLSDHALALILDDAGELEASAGQVLVHRGAAGSGMYVVEQGTVVVERDGDEIELRPGQFFGELALLTDTPRTARVRAKSDALLLAINRSDFQTLLESEPSMALAMLKVVAERLAQ